MRYHRFDYRYTKVVTKRSQWPETGSEWPLWSRRPSPNARWTPAADLLETDTTYCVTVELAGVREEDLEITIHPDFVVLEGVRTRGEDGNVRYHTAQIWRGPFRLEVPLPGPIDPDRATGCFEQGLLVLTLHKLRNGPG